MKKIGILTFHRACNYGAFLQAFALVQKINSYQDTEAYLIDYRSSYIENNYTVRGMINLKQGIKTCLLKLLRTKDIIKRNNIFKKALQDNFKLADFNDKQTLKSFTRFVVGSDQVWNFRLTGGDTTYLFDFVDEKKKKVSYAASTGLMDSEMDLSLLTEYLPNFSAISVRENNLREYLVKNISEVQVTTCVDPVFLKSKEQWRQYSGEIPIIKDNYVLIFIMGVTKQADYLVDLGERLSKIIGCKAILLGDQERWYKYRKVKHFGVATPYEFVNLIDNATCVLTNSFHATAFSIIMNSSFYVELNVGANERIKSLLKLTGLEQRGLENGVMKVDWNEPIHWDKVQNDLSSEINKSSLYIEKYIIEDNDND